MAQKIKLTKAVYKNIRATLAPQVRKSAEKIGTACNEQSSWGGYVVKHDAARSVVVALSDRKDNARSNRMLRNAERGRI